MRGSVFCIFLFALFWSIGTSAKVCATSDNTRSSSIYAAPHTSQPLQKERDKVTHAFGEDFCDKFLYTNDEEDDLLVAMPSRRHTQGVIAYFIAAYLSQSAYHTHNKQSLVNKKPAVFLSRSQICIFTI